MAAVVPVRGANPTACHARYFHTDQVDSVHIVTNDTGGAVNRTEYLPFGETWFQEGEKAYAPKFNSQELDRESGLYFFNARHQDPELGRFETADTVIDGEYSTQGWNRYSYVHNNPVKYKDPTGHAYANPNFNRKSVNVASSGKPYYHPGAMRAPRESAVTLNRRFAENLIKQANSHARYQEIMPVENFVEVQNRPILRLREDTEGHRKLPGTDGNLFGGRSTGGNVNVSPNHRGKDGYMPDDKEHPKQGLVPTLDDGVVLGTFFHHGYGNVVVIGHAGGKVSFTGHLSEVHVKEGDRLKKGEAFGRQGKSGDWQTGPHAHYGVATGVQTRTDSVDNEVFENADYKKLVDPDKVKW